jgi:peptidylprolyl isomerase
MLSKKFSVNWLSGIFSIAIAFIMSAALIFYAQPSEAALIAALPSTTAIKDARILLRQALPIDNEQIRNIQQTLEKLPRQANLKRWRNMSGDLDKAMQTLAAQGDKILASIAPAQKETAIAALTDLNKTLLPLQEAIAAKDRNSIKPLSEKSLEYVGLLESQMVQKFPFQVPDTYANLPQLKGRAIVEMETEKGSFTMTLDGFSAPVNAGQFADLVQRGFYNGLVFNRADDNYFLQAGDPPGDVDGFVDSKTGKVRTVPMEVRVPSKPEPIYGSPLAEVGYDRVTPVLPFSAYGTLAMAHPANEPNGGSSQFFIYLFESDLTPAGLNLMDGNYTVFGYVTEGEEVLRKLKLGDKIVSARLVAGAENLVQPSRS